MNNIGSMIKEKRLAKGWSKRALAEVAKISHSEVHRIENGERANPSIPVLNALADALGIPKDDMLLIAGYKQDDSGLTAFEKAFPELKTDGQKKAAKVIIDGLCRNDVPEEDYDLFVSHVEMFINNAKYKKINDS